MSGESGGKLSKLTRNAPADIAFAGIVAAMTVIVTIFIRKRMLITRPEINVGRIQFIVIR